MGSLMCVLRGKRCVVRLGGSHCSNMLSAPCLVSSVAPSAIATTNAYSEYDIPCQHTYTHTVQPLPFDEQLNWHAYNDNHAMLMLRIAIYHGTSCKS